MTARPRDFPFPDMRFVIALRAIYFRREIGYGVPFTFELMKLGQHTADSFARCFSFDPEPASQVKVVEKWLLDEGGF